MVKVLLTRGEGAHVDCPIHDGATPLFIASAMGHDEVNTAHFVLLRVAICIRREGGGYLHAGFTFIPLSQLALICALSLYCRTA